MQARLCERTEGFILVHDHRHGGWNIDIISARIARDKSGAADFVHCQHVSMAYSIRFNFIHIEHERDSVDCVPSRSRLKVAIEYGAELGAAASDEWTLSIRSRQIFIGR